MGVLVNDPSRELAALLLNLGQAGIELGLHPTDCTRIGHRPAVLPADLSARLLTHKTAVLVLLANARADGCPEATEYVASERLGVADELELATHPGSPAWLIAMGESLAAMEASASVVQAAPWAAVVQSVLGTPVRVQVIAPGERFEGEPDWGDPWARSRRPGPHAGGAA